MSTLSILLAAAALGASGCAGIGSGNLVTQQRTVGPFNSVQIESALNVELVVDASADIAVSVTYDDNVIDQIVTRVEGETLIVELDQKISLSSSGQSVSITMNTLQDMTVSGAVDLDGRGGTESYGLTVSGASEVDLSELTAKDVALEVSGASQVRIYATGSVAGSVSGASEVTVSGDPTSVDVETGGTSELNVED